MFLFAKLKIYAALIGAALVAVVTVYYRGRADGRDTLEYEIKDDRLDKLLKAKELQDELREMDDDDIAARAYGWVRNDNRG